MILLAKNPYTGADFFHFFSLLFTRLFDGSILHPAPDEIQLGVLLLIAVASGLIAPFLVLKKMSLFANSLSHTTLFGLVIAYLLGSSLWGAELFDLTTLFLGALFAALFTALLTEGLTRLFHLQEDASVGLIFTSLFALGIVLVNLYTRHAHLGVESILGNADALTLHDLKSSSLIALTSFAIVVPLFRRLSLTTFDPSFSQTLSIAPARYHFLLLLLSSAVAVSAFRAVGLLLVLSFFVAPYLTARLFSNRLALLLPLTITFSLLASLLGTALSRHLLTQHHLPLSTGGLVSLILGFGYLGALMIRRKR